MKSSVDRSAIPDSPQTLAELNVDKPLVGLRGYRVIDAVRSVALPEQTCDDAARGL